MILLRIFLLGFLLATSAHAADFRLAWMFTDHMVLQRDKPVPIWGWAAPRAGVTVSCNGRTAIATAGADGKWTAWLPAQAAGGPFTLTATSGGQTLTRNDVLIGDVWLVSGQSNAAFGLGSCVSPSNDVQIADINTANYPHIRFTGFIDNAGQREPWIELYNAGTNSVNLAGLYLANSYANLTQWAFPAGAVINPGEFKVVVADSETHQSTTAELHTDFRLAATSGAIALARLSFDQPEVLDYINYADVPASHSYGSAPDGQPFARQVMGSCSPGATNHAAVGWPPLIAMPVMSGAEVTLRFTTTPGHLGLLRESPIHCRPVGRWRIRTGLCAIQACYQPLFCALLLANNDC